MKLQEYIVNISKDHPIYMPYLTAGDPDFETTVRLAVAMIDEGAHVIELGIPFSDPTADGPVIEKAMVRAMGSANFSVKKVLDTAGEIHKARPDIPIVLLTYLNPVLKTFPAYTTPEKNGTREDVETVVTLSAKAFLKRCSEVGVKGIVIPDLPHDQLESVIIRKLGREMEIDQVLMVAPTTRKKRKEEICNLASGFIYYVTSTGVTGVRTEFPPDMESNIRKLKDLTDVPVLAGFGFNNASQMRGWKGLLDGVIVGSHNHRLIEELGMEAEAAIRTDTRSFVAALASS